MDIQTWFHDLNILACSKLFSAKPVNLSLSVLLLILFFLCFPSLSFVYMVIHFIFFNYFLVFVYLSFLEWIQLIQFFFCWNFDFSFFSNTFCSVFAFSFPCTIQMPKTTHLTKQRHRSRQGILSSCHVLLIQFSIKRKKNSKIFSRNEQKFK